MHIREYGIGGDSELRGDFGGAGIMRIAAEYLQLACAELLK